MESDRNTMKKQDKTESINAEEPERLDDTRLQTISAKDRIKSNEEEKTVESTEELDSQVTTVTLENLPGCSLSTLSECNNLQTLTVRRCGLTSLDGLNQCAQIRYIDVQENSITYVDCGGLANLQVLLLGRNQLMNIHGLDGAENLQILQLSHNNISRISGLGPLKMLLRLSVDHNQLLSTRGLNEIYTLLHLDCSYNHLSHIEGLENCALLNTLDLRGNSLTEVPVLQNHVLLRDLHLDDNLISSVHDLESYWLPLLQNLSVAHNRSLVLETVPGLIKLNNEQTAAATAPRKCPDQQWSFQALCQAQQEQRDSLLQQQKMETSSAPSQHDAQLLAIGHQTDLFRLAVDQRYAHEYGDSCVTEAAWRGCVLRKKLACALAAAQITESDEDFEEVDMDEFIFDEKALEKDWITLDSKALPARMMPFSEQLPLPKSPLPLPMPPKTLSVFPPQLKHAWSDNEGAACLEQSMSPHLSSRSSLRSHTLSERSEKIIKEWGFANESTALLMLKRASRMKGRKQQQKRTQIHVWPCSGATVTSMFPQKLKSGHVLLSRTALKFTKQRMKFTNYRMQRKNSLTRRELTSGSTHKQFIPTQTPQARDETEVPSPTRVNSAPIRNERISFRDNPVRRSGGWGGGKKRAKLSK
ncbi:leucine-rich repeat and IQ domain-containing 1 [Labeo rohita]|uniref:Leucine-rich repeat and IQ domain-containing 1 n=1 Tax=Labeo rohita TaxID=84645 RepID=A0A498MDL3_LABRO|nr:leucine-rich repeat and IQ domain-containing 1 [Labeo rohita]